MENAVIPCSNSSHIKYSFVRILLFLNFQDTCVGLTALSGFAKLVYGDSINIDVTVTGGSEENFHIDDENKLLVQRKKVATVPSELIIEATGSGCGLIQVSYF